MPRCVIDSCLSDAWPGKRKMCNAHYLRWKRHGNPLIQLRKSPSSDPVEIAARIKAEKKRDYERHKDAYKSRAAKWREENPERYRARVAEYFGREDIRAKMREKSVEWRKANPGRKRESDKKFYEQNKSLVRSYKAKRRAAVLRATPPWLTAEHEAQIRAIYAQAEMLTAQTGIEHQVDHHVPLQGKVVFGLHVPWNLRVLTKDENNRRSRVWSEGVAS